MRSVHNGYLLLPVTILLATLALASFLLARGGAVQRSVVRAGHDASELRLIEEAGIAHMRQQLQGANCTGYTNLTDTPFGSHSYSATVSPTSGTPVTITVTANHASGVTSTRTVTTTAYQPYEQSLLQPDPADGKDAMISSLTPLDNYGVRVALYIGTYENSLMEFDLSALPPNVEILHADLQLYMQALNTAGTVAIHRISEAWDEGTRNGNGIFDGATWSNRTSLLIWTIPGGTHAQAPTARAAIDSAGRWYNWDLTRLTRAWYAGARTNTGFLLTAEDGLAGAQPYSSDTSATDASGNSLRPRFSVMHACPCGSDCTLLPSCSAQFNATSVDSALDTAAVGADNVRGLTFLREGEVFNGESTPAGGAWLFTDYSDDMFYMTDLTGTLLTSRITPNSNPAGVARVRGGAWSGDYAVVDISDNRVYRVNAGGSTVTSFSMPLNVSSPWAVAYIASTASATYDTHLAVTTQRGLLGLDDPYVRIFDQSGIQQASFSTGGFAPDPQGVAHIEGTDELLVLDQSGLLTRVNFTGTQLAQYDAGTGGLQVTDGQALALDYWNCYHAAVANNSDTIRNLAP